MGATCPDLSICIPVYNGDRYVGQTLASALSQTHSNIEVIVLNNASSDTTAEILASFEDSRLRVLTNDSTVPPNVNWSKSIGLASGTWTKLLCADDVLERNAVEETLEISERFPEANAVAGTRSIINSSGRQIREPHPVWKHEKLVSLEELSRRVCLMGSNPLGEGLVVSWRTKLTPKVGAFSPDWKYFIDLDYWLRLSALGPIAVSPRRMGSFRISEHSWTSQIGMRNIAEAKRFFGNHPQLRTQTRTLRQYGYLQSILRSVARAGFSAARQSQF